MLRRLLLAVCLAVLALPVCAQAQTETPPVAIPVVAAMQPPADGAAWLPVGAPLAPTELTTLDSLFTTLAAQAGTPTPPHVTAHLPTRQLTGPDRNQAAACLLLLPGTLSLQVDGQPPRPIDTPEAADDRLVGPAETSDPALSTLLDRLITFRQRHPAVQRGEHRPLGTDPYVFWRALARGTNPDHVVVALGVQGRTTLTVSRVFPDDVVLRDALTGKIALVTYGSVAFTPGETGMLLLEEVK